MTLHMYLANTDPKKQHCVCGAEYRTRAHPHRFNQAPGTDRCTCGLTARDRTHTGGEPASTRYPSTEGIG